MKTARELQISDIGKTFRSITYPNNNKTAKPNRQTQLVNGRLEYVVRPQLWTLKTIYAHANGNIKINNYFHLRADTELEEVSA